MKQNSLRWAAIGVHLYTALGMVCAVVGMVAILQKDIIPLLITFWVAVLIDSTDGFLARKVNVKALLPEFDGSKLDDIVDFLNYAFLPAIALVQFGLIPAGQWGWACLPVLASAYGFCQQTAKTADAFIGFPSYWNLLFIYFYIFQTPPLWVVCLLVIFAVLVFVPIHYVYPSRTPMLWRLTNALGALYALAFLALCLAPHASWAKPLAWGSLLYALYYLVISLIHHQRVSRHAA